MLNKISITFFILILSAVAFSQGVVSGVVKDSTSGEPVIYAKVKVEGLNKGTTTGFDGDYRIKLEAGTYTLIFSNFGEGYIDLKKTITIKNQDVVLNVKMSKDDAVIIAPTMEVVATKKGEATTVAAADEDRRDQKAPVEIMTAEQVEESGKTDAASAVAMAPGVSIEDGKTVYVRGLGDRYTKTILNGMDLPGLDPDRNAVQMDIFPSKVIANITVYKTFTPNLAGDFTGGLVDITTKDYPSKRTMSVKLGLGYNTVTTFNSNYIGYKGGKLDFIGFDDGTRKMPIASTTRFPDPTQNDPRLTALTKSFSNTMATQKAMSFLNQSYAFTYGDKIVIKDKEDKNRFTYGYNFVLNYRNTHQFYDNVEFNEYRKDIDRSVNKLEKDRRSSGQLAENNVMWTAMLGQSFKVKNSKYKLTLFHTQNGISSASNLIQVNSESNPATLMKQGLTYTQRSVSNANLSGLHYLDANKKWKAEWKLSPTYSRISDPDIRSTVLEMEEDQHGNVRYLMEPAVGSEIRRIFRSLSEINGSGRFDITYKFNVWDSLGSELSFGASNSYKRRTMDVFDYIFNVENGTEFSGDPDWYFREENIWNTQTDKGTYGVGERQLANSFVASQNVIGAYVMNDLPVTKAFNITYGARMEKATNRYTGQNNQGTIRYNNSKVLDEMNILPSVNMVYKFERKADSTRKAVYNNIRGAFATTLARPSFKEKSIANIYDPIQGRRFNGNIDLEQTVIHNLDLRWEMFFGRTELISVSGFYKKFINPIELVANAAAPSEIQPVNAGEANIYGGEVEFRKAIGFMNKPHIRFTVGANFTYVLSQIDMNKVKTVVGGKEFTEKEIRQENARDGEVIGDYRRMFGQSPYIVNAFVSFKNDSLGLIFNATYNVQGKKLAVIGIGALPDVYENPFHSLNLKITKSLGKQSNWKASVNVRNILLSKRVREYVSYGAENQIYDFYDQGMSITGSITYQLSGWNKKKK